MAWWISGGIVVLALIGLSGALLSAVRSLRRLELAMRSLQRRLTDGTRWLQPRALELRERLDAMEPGLVAAQERALLIQARKSAD